MLSTLLISCGSVKVHVNNDHTYSHKTPITINKTFNDESDALGEIIMTAHFRGDKSCKAVLKEFVNKLNSVIK